MMIFLLYYYCTHFTAAEGWCARCAQPKSTGPGPSSTRNQADKQGTFTELRGYYSTLKTRTHSSSVALRLSVCIKIVTERQRDRETERQRDRDGERERESDSGVRVATDISNLISFLPIVHLINGSL